jgi:hypothetical protein
MLGAIKYNLSHLLDFSGRDARQTFWYYVLFLVMLDIADRGRSSAFPLMSRSAPRWKRRRREPARTMSRRR